MGHEISTQLLWNHKSIQQPSNEINPIAKKKTKQTVVYTQKDVFEKINGQ
jgi:hypothetical protein